MATHAHYVEIAADTPYDLGLALGRAFGAALRPFAKTLPPLPEKVWPYLDDCWALTRELFPDYAAEIEGYAAGAGLPRRDLWQMVLEDDTETFVHGKCTTFVTNGGRLIGHNEDWHPSGAGRLFLLRRTLAGRTAFELHYAGTLGGNSLGVSDSGLVQTINSMDATPLDTAQPRLPTNITGRLLAESGDVRATVRRLRDLPRMRGYAHTLVPTAGGQAYLLEAAQKDMTLREISHFPYVHTNHYTLEGMLHFNRQPPDYYIRSYLRYAMARRCASARMLAPEAQHLLEDKSAGPILSILSIRTIAGVVVDLDDACAWITLASEADKGWLRYPLDFL